jgi:hypothetical protein
MTNINKILEEREKTHGNFEKHSTISQSLKCIIAQNNGRTLSIHREAIDMILHKIARIIVGDPNVQDHWDDIGGYAKLVSNYIAKKEKENEQLSKID